MQFRVGEEVDWLGAKGKIIDITHIESNDTSYIVVDFDGAFYFFDLNGRFLPNQEPSLRKAAPDV